MLSPNNIEIHTHFNNYKLYFYLFIFLLPLLFSLSFWELSKLISISFQDSLSSRASFQSSWGTSKKLVVLPLRDQYLTKKFQVWTMILLFSFFKDLRHPDSFFVVTFYLKIIHRKRIQMFLFFCMRFRLGFLSPATLRWVSSDKTDMDGFLLL